MKSYWKISTIAGPLLMISMGCSLGSTPTTGAPPPSACAANQAQISVFDGFLQIQCGCSEAQGTRATNNEVLNCTVPAGTTVFFHFDTTELNHQIVSTGSPNFQSSPPSIPSDRDPIRVHAIAIEEAGTYEFEDAFNDAISGRIVVQ